ncbi:hypothetical protein G7Y89_g14298 [Cudoniella acicularis]|uniref:Cupin type-1 domain-containing protein n=1 Tax=Cudoniella acicularis TaxID=354080 RepID=A0A8H4R3R9_9HELO|nr:hypothetical protein G7Y89_g14298 [Cudoniella acicularis]
MHLFTLLAVSASLMASANAFPIFDHFGLATRHPDSADVANMNLQHLATRKNSNSKTSTSADSRSKSKVSATSAVNEKAMTTSAANVKDTATSAANEKATTTSAANVKATTAAKSTVDIDPDFNEAAATSAEKAAAAAATSLAASANELKVSQLMTASSAVQKLDILSDDSDWKFDFNTESASVNGLGGTIVTANLASFPVTQMTGSSMAIRVMGACGFTTPHSHPRANELNLITQGELVTTMTLENGARVINQTVGFQQMTVFPQGSMDMEFNPGCTNTTFVAAFTNADAGVQQTDDGIHEFRRRSFTSYYGWSTDG